MECNELHAVDGGAWARHFRGHRFVWEKRHLPVTTITASVWPEIHNPHKKTPRSIKDGGWGVNPNLVIVLCCAKNLVVESG